jgi:hypothetical protein
MKCGSGRSGHSVDETITRGGIAGGDGCAVHAYTLVLESAVKGGKAGVARHGDSSEGWVEDDELPGYNIPLQDASLPKCFIALRSFGSARYGRDGQDGR